MTSDPHVPTRAAQPRRHKRRPRSGRNAVGDVFYAAALVLIAVLSLAPVFWMILSSLKTRNQIFSVPPLLIFTPTLSHYAEVFAKGIGYNLLNSLIIAAASTLIALAVGVPAAYALARFDFRGKRDLWFWFITNRMIIPVVLVVPYFLIAKSLSLIDSRWILILIYLVANVPLVIWLCADQFRALPVEVEEAAVIDGAGTIGVLTRIALPLALPAITVGGILSFIFSWNELLYAMILTNNEARTAPVAALAFLGGYDIPWGLMMATGTLIVLPVIVFAMLVSRYLVSGLTMGAIK